MAKRKICVVTGTRAEYGLLYWLLQSIAEDPDLELQVVATGMHLSPEFGLTYRTIEADGFQIDSKVEMLLSSDSPVGIAKSIGLGTIGFADAFERLGPDIVVLLGDRYEVLAAAQAAMVGRLPIAHLHGGELTEGVTDESIRHAVTKMAHLHFVAAEPYRQRVIQLGEQPGRVYNFGAPGLDNITHLHLLSRAELERQLNFTLGSPLFLVTYHPATLGEYTPEQAMRELLKALDAFPEASIVFTKPNSDVGGRVIGYMIDDYVGRLPHRAMVATCLGTLRYLSVMKYADAVIGNSSSGIIEAPALRKATVNIGARQRGRLRAESVIDVEEKTGEIINAVRKAQSSEFRTILETMVAPYGEGNTSHRIKKVLKDIDLAGLVNKKFHDVGA